jgi:cell division protein FtsW (lipid II flippase)
VAQTTSLPSATRRLPRRSSLQIPAWRRGPKPKRRTELGLLVMSSVVTVALYVVAEVGAKSKIPEHVGPILGVILVLALVAHLANRWLVPNANPVVLPLVALLNGIGYVIIVRWTPPAAKAQATWTGLGVLLYVLTLLVVRHSRDLDRYRYLLFLVAAALLIAPLIPHFGLDIGGARLFVHVGPIQFQPIEVAKLLLVIFFASYFAERKELLSIPTARMGNRLVIDPRPLVPILLFWGFTMAVIGIQDNVGFAMLIFTMFIAMLWITTGRWAYLLLAIVLFGAGAVLASHLFPQVHTRIETWLHAAPTSQLGTGEFAIANGGVGGAGLGLDKAAGTIPLMTSDMIFAPLADEMGFVGAAAVVMAYALIVGAGLRIAQTARSDFSRLVAVGLTTILGLQAFFIMAGVIRLLPFTGITLPFVAYGGSSLVANYILIALLMRVSEEGTSSSTERAMGLSFPGETSFVEAP